VREFAESDYGQNIGWLYSHVGVSGPTEFGRLPLEDQLYWDAFLKEHIRRVNDGEQSLNGGFGGL